MFAHEGFLQEAEGVALDLADLQIDKPHVPTAGELLQQENLWDTALLDQGVHERNPESFGQLARPVEVGLI
jgi:hypothetical protein